MSLGQCSLGRGPKEERIRGLCYRCRQRGHRSQDCPATEEEVQQLQMARGARLFEEKENDQGEAGSSEECEPCGGSGQSERDGRKMGEELGISDLGRGNRVETSAQGERLGAEIGVYQDVKKQVALVIGGQKGGKKQIPMIPLPPLPPLPKPHRSEPNQMTTQSGGADVKEQKVGVEAHERGANTQKIRGLCYKCRQRGHRSQECPATEEEMKAAWAFKGRVFLPEV